MIMAVFDMLGGWTWWILVKIGFSEKSAFAPKLEAPTEPASQ